MEAKHASSSTDTRECDTLGTASTVITQVEVEGSDGGVEGSQDDNEDAEGDWAASSNVSVDDGDVASDNVGGCKCENDGTLNNKRRHDQ